MAINERASGDGVPNMLNPRARHAEWQSVIIWRIARGKLAENWVVTDRLSEYRQLGIISDAELATAEEPTVVTPVP